MSDDDSLLRAILNDPEDDAPRLVYADWLDERGDAARATFIRTQIRLATLSSDAPERDRLVQTERTLWRANRAAWTSWLPSWARATEFRRGFLERIQANAADFLAGADEIRRRAPIVAARIDGKSEFAVPLFRSRVLEGLRALRIGINVPANSWEHLGQSTSLEKLVDLDLTSSDFPRELLQAVTASPAFPNLHSLRLKWCGLGDEGSQQIVTHPWVAQLKHLDLGSNHITATGSRPIVDSPHLERIVWLNLRGNPLTENSLASGALRERFGHRVRL